VRPYAAAVLATALLACRPGGRADLSSPDPARRAAAVERLSDPRDASELAALLVAQQDPHPRVRAAAAAALGARGGTRSLEGLSAMLADPDPEVVSAAAHALASLRPEGASPDARLSAEVSERAGRALAQAYGRADPRTRLAIASALRALGTSLREAVEAEARQLWEQAARELRSGSATARAGAAEELGRSGRADAVRILVDLLEDEGSDLQLAAAAARGLGMSGDRDAVEPLEAALFGRPAVVSEAAAWALGRIGDPQAAGSLADLGCKAPALLASSAVAALDAFPPAPAVGLSLCEVALRAPDPAVAGAAAAAVHERAGDCPDRPLTQRIGRGGAEAVAGLSALGALRLPPDRLRAPAEKAVALLSTSTDAGVRAAAARALGTAPFPPAVPALQRRLAALRPSDVEEWAEVAVALARLDPQQSGPLAARLAAASDPRLRVAACRALSAARPPDAAGALANLSVDPDAEVRRAAYLGLGPLGAPAVAPLAAALSSRSADPEEVEAIVRALGASGDASAVPIVAPFLAGALAPAAAGAIGRLASPAGVPVLLAALQSGGAAGRLEVVEALSALGSTEAGEALSAELLSDRPTVRAAAARALGRLRYEPASGRLEALRSDYDADVRRASREALARLPVRLPRKP
jgi:HEAT repeat protein